MRGPDQDSGHAVPGLRRGRMRGLPHDLDVEQRVRVLPGDDLDHGDGDGDHDVRGQRIAGDVQLCRVRRRNGLNAD